MQRHICHLQFGGPASFGLRCQEHVALLLWTRMRCAFLPDHFFYAHVFMEFPIFCSRLKALSTSCINTGLAKPAQLVGRLVGCTAHLKAMSPYCQDVDAASLSSIA